MKAEATLGFGAEHESGRIMSDRGRVQEAIARLKPSDRDVLSLVLWEQLSHSEAAQVLGCSVNAVGLRLHKVKSRLRKELVPGQSCPPTIPTIETDFQRREGLDDEP